jgi:hypothetical protein
MASTSAGQRRILKKQGTVIEYIRRAVETGVYRTDEELEQVRKERRLGNDDLRVIMQRFRQDIVRGSAIHDYPVEYLILQQHPPIPDPPRTPVKFLKQLQAPPNPIDRLTKKYLQREQQQSGGSSGPVSTEDYYRRLLGVQAAEASSQQQYSSLRQKPAAVQKAYAAAIAHYQLQRTDSLSDKEAMRRVDELLLQQSRTEQEISRERTVQAQAYRDSVVSKKKTVKKESPVRSSSSNREYPFASLQASADRFGDDDTSHGAESTTARTLESSSIFSSSPRTVEGMMRWSERLQAVPYTEWTVGASTALDHWIARQVLGLSEETWQSALEGDDPALLSVGRDIVACREALFPETILADTMSAEARAADFMEDNDGVAVETEHEKETRSIEDLLQALGGLKAPDAAADQGKPAKDDWSFLREAEEDADLDAKVERLVHELQSWRRRNMETPYDDWTAADKERFNTWMKKYVSELASGAERYRPVDYESTREALLSEPPVTAVEADAFWSQLTDQGKAEALLDAMIEDGPPAGATILQSAFWDLPRSEQVERLLNLGALRPLLDEYTKESDRLRFLQRHGDTMLAGVELEHLIVDAAGPIQVSDLSRDVVNQLRIPQGARFRLEKRPYKSGGEDLSEREKSRALFKAWNEHKAGRARYEEKLFQTGRLGLRYSDKIVDDELTGKK